MVQIGYYPGQPIPRPPKGKPIPPNEYNFSAVSEWVNQLNYDVSGLPDQVKNAIVDDFKRQLTVSASPKKPEYDKQRALLYGDVDEAPGVQLRLSINPADWLNDPSGQAQKTLKSWGEAITNRTDLNNWVERHYFWEPLLSGRDELAPEVQKENFPTLLEPVENAALKTASTVAGQKKFGNNPFHLTDFEVEQAAPWMARRSPSEKEVGKDEYKEIAGTGKQNVYQATAEKFLNFVDRAESAAQRNTAYNSLAFEAVNAVKVELENRFGARVEETADAKALDSFNGLAKFGKNEHPDIKNNYGFVKGFKIGNGVDQLSEAAAAEMASLYTGHALADSMRFFGSGPTGVAGVAGLTKNLSAIALEGTRAVSGTNERINLVDVLTKAKGSIVDDELARIQGIESWLTYIRDNQPNASQQFKNHIDGILNSFRNDPITQQYKQKVLSLGNLLDDAIQQASQVSPTIDAQGSPAAKALIQKLNPRLKDIQASVQDTGFFGKGLYHDHLNRLTAAVTDKKTVFGKVGHMDELLDSAVDYAEKTGRGTGIINTRNLLELSKRNFDRNDVKDFLRNYEDGKIFTSYVLPKIKNYIPYTEPVERFLKRRHYFGLVYDPSEMERNVRVGLPFAENPLFMVNEKGEMVHNLDAYSGLSLKNGTYEYLDLSNLDKYSKWMPRNTFGLIGANGQRFVAQGGKHFRGAVDIHNELRRVTSDNKFEGGLKALLDKRGHFKGFSKAEDAVDLITLLNGGKPGTFNVGNVIKTDEQVARYMAQVGLFKAWLYKHQKELGLVFDAQHNLVMEGKGLEQNAEALTRLFKQLGERILGNEYIDILWERVGVLQKVASYGAQIRAWGSKQIAPFIAPYTQLRNAVVNSLVLGLSTFFKGLAGASTGGAGAFIVKFIEPVIRFVVNAIAVKVEAFFTSIIKGDYSKFAKQMEKLINNSVKYSLYIIAIPMLIFLAFSFLFFGTSLSTIAQVDWTRSNEMGGVVPAGPGTYAGCGVPEYANSNGFAGSVPAGCFVFKDESGNMETYDGTKYNLTGWSESNISTFQQALQTIAGKTGNYLQRLCSAGQVTLLRSSDTKTWCGHYIGNGQIVFNSLCTYSNADYVAYLLAHETGHVYATRYPALNDFKKQVLNVEGSKLPTYDRYCGTEITLGQEGEDFAETIGNWVQVNSCSCGGIATTYGNNWQNFWNAFPVHFSWARNFFSQ